MAAITIPCLVPRTRARKGTSWYWVPSATLKRAGFRLEALGKDETVAINRARAINQQVDAWKAGGPVTFKVEARRQAGTVAWLIGQYREKVVKGINPATRQPRLKPKTAEGYETALRRIDEWAGKHPLAYVTPARVTALRDAIVRPPGEGGIGHAPAFVMLKTLRQLFAFAERIDAIPKRSNPATDFELGAPPARAVVWELEDDAAFDAAAYKLGLPGMVLAREIALYSAQREGDLIAFTEGQLQPLHQIHDETVRRVFADEHGLVRGWCFTQSKSISRAKKKASAPTVMEIPMEQAMLRRIDEVLRTNRARDRARTPPVIISHVLVDDRTGLPWKKRAFIAAYRQILTEAARATGRTTMAGLVWHDLRRTRVVRLRRMGFRPEQIATITGHSPQSIQMMLEVYGPIDATMTANTLAAAITALPTSQPQQNPFNKPANQHAS